MSHLQNQQYSINNNNKNYKIKIKPPLFPSIYVTRLTTH